MARKRVPGPWGVGVNAAASATGGGPWSRASSIGLSLVVALLPKCSACLVVHGSILAAMGLTTVPHLPRPIVAVALLATLAVLAHGASARQGYGPVALACVASLLLLAELMHAHGVPAGAHSEHAITTGVHGPLSTWAGGVLLFAASLWNAWPRNPRNARTHGDCDTPCRAPAADPSR